MTLKVGKGEVTLVNPPLLCASNSALLLSQNRVQKLQHQPLQAAPTIINSGSTPTTKVG